MVLKPTRSLCPVCGTDFPQPDRPQGGGKRTIYCSPKCRTKDWARGNSGRKASVLKYDSRPENKAAKADRNRALTLKKYGLSKQDFAAQLARQNRSCYGCLSPIDEKSARIDHDHASGKVRGLLCDSCNWALGHAKDNPMTLRRLMAFLDYHREKTSVYLTGALKNERVPQIGNKLRAAGFEVMDEWFTPGEFADTNWQEYERQRGRSYEDALRGRAATNIFMFDRSYLDHSDIVVLVAPAGKSAMLELGYAKGRGKYVCILLDGVQPDRYDLMPAIVDDVFFTEDDMIAALESRKR